MSYAADLLEDILDYGYQIIKMEKNSERYNLIVAKRPCTAGETFSSSILLMDAIEEAHFWVVSEEEKK